MSTGTVPDRRSLCQVKRPETKRAVGAMRLRPFCFDQAAIPLHRDSCLVAGRKSMSVQRNS